MPATLADPATNFGAVAYPYSMGEYDVTMGQYTAFLNAVATSGDPYGLWTVSMSSATPTYGITRTTTSGSFSYSLVGNSANVPVTYVSWGDAARFVNWIQNGEPNAPEGPGTTETGTYALNGSTGSAQLMAVTRSSTATWVIPTINEWYKAGWYVGGGTNAGYWLYPTQNNNTPSYVLSATGTNNANFTTSISTPPFTTSSDPTDWLTPVGAFADSPSAYGTYDEGGDVEQWNEAVDPGIGRGGGGGSWAGDYVTLVSGGVGYGPPSGGGPTTGFRVALVPEPNSLLLLAPFAASLLIFGTIRWIPRSGKKARARQMRGSRQRIGCRWLRLERLEEKRLLTGLLYFDSAAGSSGGDQGQTLNYNYRLPGPSSGRIP